MRALRLQYVLTYAVIGTLSPYAPVFLKDRGFNDRQIGYTIAAGAAAMIIMPILITLLADTRFDPRRLVSVILGLATLVLAALTFAHGFWPILLLFALYSLSTLPMRPVHDGITFSIERKRRAAGLPVIPFHMIRVWGTIGFILPSLLLFVLLSPQVRRWPLPAGVAGLLAWTGGHIEVVLVCAGAFSLVAALHAFWLEDPRPPAMAQAQQTNPAGPPRPRQLPTLEAAKLFISPKLIGFFLATMLGGAAMASYYTFFPAYLTDVVKLDKSWVGIIVNVGTVAEVFCTISFAWLVRRIGLRWLVFVGLASIAVRLALFALWPNIWTILFAQLLHGVTIISLLLAPAIIFNENAADHYRHSVQGMYTMLLGATRTVATLLAGLLAAWSLRGLFLISAGVGVAAAVVLLVGFHQQTLREPGMDTAPVPEPADAE